MIYTSERCFGIALFVTGAVLGPPTTSALAQPVTTGASSGAPGAPAPGGAALAAQSDKAPEAASQQPPQEGLQDIVVTARRRAERQQDVPVAITAFSGADLAQRQITQVGDLARNTVGLQFVPSSQGNSLPAFTIRSQRQQSPIITNDPSIAVYFADVVQARPHGVNAGLFDISSVQVLKGPQGTLFGRNSTGGAILITPQAPTSVLEGYVNAGYGNYDARTFEGVLNVPISDMLQLRIGGNVTRHDGYIVAPNTPGGRIDNERTESWRASLRFTPTDWLKNDLVVSGFHENDAGAAYKLVNLTPGGIATRLYPTLPAELATVNANQYQYSTLADDPHGTKVKTINVSNITSIDLGGPTLKNIFGYRHINSQATFILDGSSKRLFVNVERLVSDQYSDELQLLGTTLSNQLDYIAGLYYFRETGADGQISIPLTTVNNVNANAKNVSKSAFAQVTYRPDFMSGVSLTGGLRYTHDYREMKQRSFSNGTCRLVDADVGGAPLNPCFRDVDASFSRLTYTASADWKISRGTLLYVTHRKGYRSGGFNFAGDSPSQVRPYAPETVLDYEAGVKLDWRLGAMNGRLNLAAYHQDYNDIQRQTAVSANSTRASIINAASAKIDGVEVEATWFPVRQFELFAGYAYSNPRYKRFIAPNGVDYTKAAFAGAPKNSVNAHARWTQDLPTGNVSAQLSYYYQSGTVSNDVTSLNVATGTTRVESTVPSYQTIDARLAWTDAFGRKGLELAAFGRNLANEKYITSIQDFGTSLGFGAALLGAPRTYGVEATFRF